MEEEVVFFLLQMTAPRHEMRAAFAPGAVKGRIYLEATMNEQLRNLLKLTPGIARTRFGLSCQMIPFDDGVKSLEVRQFMQPEDVGKWVRVRKGIYKGDVGYVLSAESWGVRLLLVPRFPPPQSTSGSCLKRKRSHLRSAPALFNQESIGKHYNTVPNRVMENICTFEGHTFEYGLIVTSYDFYSVSTTVSCMPLELFTLFWQSRHPRLAKSVLTFPRPLEWHFAEGDEVYVSEGNKPLVSKKGTVKTLRTESVDVDLASGEGVVSAPWMDVRKVVHVSEFVKATGGLYQNRTGWVIRVDAENDYVTEHTATVFLADDEENPSSSHVKACTMLDSKNSPIVLTSFRHLKSM